MFIGVANCVYATLLAYVLYLLFEAPYVNLMKVLIMPAISGKGNSITITGGSSNPNASATDANNNLDNISKEYNGGELSMAAISGNGSGQSQHANTQT